MKSNRIVWLVCLLGLLLSPRPGQAAAADLWWNDAWPYRLPVTVSGSGVAQVSIDFTASFTSLGLNNALLDLRSIRVVPYSGTTPGAPLPYAETYSAMLHNAESTTGWSLNSSSTNGGALTNDSARFSQGSKSVKAVIDNKKGHGSFAGKPPLQIEPLCQTNS